MTFKTWLSQGLQDQYVAIATALVPEELLQLARNYDPALADPPRCNRDPAVEADGFAALRGLAVGSILSGMLWAVLVRAFG